jgi:hypothetical protein
MSLKFYQAPHHLLIWRVIFSTINAEILNTPNISAAWVSLGHQRRTGDATGNRQRPGNRQGISGA